MGLEMDLSYVLITAARNEELTIGKTIESVIGQTVPPRQWVIVSDGSTDGTDAIVEKYVRQAPFIMLLRAGERNGRDFAGKAEAINMGFMQVSGLEFDIVCNLDADISFEPDFFEFLLGKFREMPELGVAGTDYVEGGFHSFKDSYINPDHVNGQCQMFRRKCFESIGGYSPVEGGGIDWLAVTTARMKGWTTRSFGEKTYLHNHRMGRTHGNVLAARFHYGRKDYVCGGHPLWQILRSLFQMTKKPYFIGGFLLLAGYVWSFISGAKRIAPKDLVQFHRGEQMRRLRSLVVARGSRSR
jgi:poly-beta-1,6-N-acetyl-D-glucosamine synthase